MSGGPQPNAAVEKPSDLADVIVSISRKHSVKRRSKPRVSQGVLIMKIWVVPKIRVPFR